MSLNLKVSIPAQGTTKVVRFTEQMSVHEACKVIQEKATQGGKDHGIFQPSEAEPNSMGRWLRPDKTLEFYDLKANDTIIYKKKSETIKVKLVDDTVKTVLVDLSVPMIEVVESIASKVGLKNPGEFSLQDQKGWLKNTVPIPEQTSTLDQVFVLKKKFFVNDANVSQDDPMELHLVYCQSRDDIVAGNHPCTKEEAIQFACLHCQILHGSLNPDLHKPGWLNMKDVLPPQYRNKDIEKRVLEEWKKLVGMTEINARYRYVQLCRSLKTYGMTCFKVREKVKDKKKLFDAVLCFTRDSIIRMEYETKRVIKEHPFKHLLRWAASPETFTMDFGSYEEEYVVVVTNEGEPISNLIAGYIDLLLKKQRDTGIVIEEDDADVAEVENIARVGAVASTAMTAPNIGSSKIPTFSAGVNDLYAAQAAMEKMKNELFAVEMPTDSGLLTPEQRRGQVGDHAKSLQAMAEAMENMAKAGNKNAMNAAALKMVQTGEQLVVAARAAAANSNDPNDLLMVETSKTIVDALKNLLNTAQAVANNPNDPNAKEALLRAQAAAQAALQKLAAVARGAAVDDEGFKQLFREMARAVGAEANELLGKAGRAENAIPDPTKRDQLQKADKNLAGSIDHLATITDMMGPTAKDATCKNSIEKAGKALESAAAFVVATAKTSGVDPKAQQAILDSQKRLAKALENLMGVTELPDFKGSDQSDDFAQAAQAILQSAATLLASEGNPELIKQQAVVMKNAVAKLGNAGKGIIQSNPDPMTRERLANYLKGVVEGAKKVLQTAQNSAANPQDKAQHKQLRDATGEVAEATQAMLADAGKTVAVAALFNSAKLAAASATKLCTSSRVAANGNISDAGAEQALNDATKATAEAVEKLLGAMKKAVPGETGRPNRKSMSFNRKPTMTAQTADNTADIMQACDAFAPAALKLVSQAKAASAKVMDNGMKQDLVYTSNNTAKAIQGMLENRKALKGLKGQLETAEAIEEFKAAISDLDAALISADTGILPSNANKDRALAEMADSMKNLEEMAQRVITTAQNAPEDLGQAMKQLSAATMRTVAAATSLAGTLNDKSLQKGLLNSTKQLASQLKQLIQISRAVSSAPDDRNLNNLLGDAGKSVSDALAKLTAAANGITPKQIEDFQKNSAGDLEDLAEKELQGAADVIEKCVAKLTAATEAARERMTAKGIDIDEQNITEAILESCQAIAQSTAVLVKSAAAVQQEYQKLTKEPKDAKTVYRRDPQWAQGLVSAARTVAGAVTHLVKAANSAAQGAASEELLIVAAQSVSAATTQLVTASTVKSANVSSQNQSRLNDAAKKVTAATQSLVNAAKSAASWEEEQQRQQEAEKYSLADSKIKEMEQQMAILRLEKELERARNHLGSMRKNEYQKDVTPEYSAAQANQGPAKPASQRNLTSSGNAPARPAPGSPAPATGSAPPPRPAARPAVGNAPATGGVNWKQPGQQGGFKR